MRKTYEFIISGNGNINIYMNGKIYNISPDHIYYDVINDHLFNKEYDKIAEIINKPIEKFIKERVSENISIHGNKVYYKDIETKNSITKKIQIFMANGLPIDPLIRFLDNLMKIPDKKVVDGLDRYMEGGIFSMTEDGCFLAYKRVSKDYKDFWTGKISNKIGTIVKMDRRAVDCNNNIMCSYGLHVCAKEYLPHYHGGWGIIILVKVNPRDVVSIPGDYNYTKIRCCEYKVIQQIDNIYEDIERQYLEAPLYIEEKGKLKPMKKKTPRRGPDGRFIKKYAPKRGPDGRFIKN